MWLHNLKEMKKRTEMSTKQIADKTKLPERTVSRIFSGETDHPRVDTVHLIVTAMGGTLNDIFADTNVIVATESLVEVKEVVEVVEAERDLIIAENEMLKAKTAAQDIEIQLLKRELQHKEELLAVYNYFTKIKTGD
jgi:transcriptional regulator with XRE-family HTH domain